MHLRGPGAVGKREQLLVSPLEEQLEVLHRRRVAVLEADQEALFDDAELYGGSKQQQKQGGAQQEASKRR